MNNASALLSPYLFSFCDQVSIPQGGQQSKALAQRILNKDVFSRQNFKAGGLLGSHSIRKYAATHIRRCGLSKDNIDIRGRRKGQGRVSDVY
jgi:hypothetical protein